MTASTRGCSGKVSSTTTFPCPEGNQVKSETKAKLTLLKKPQESIRQQLALEGWNMPSRQEVVLSKRDYLFLHPATKYHSSRLLMRSLEFRPVGIVCVNSAAKGVDAEF